MVLSLRSTLSGALRGSVKVPGDKSISHRALMIASQAEGRSRVTGLLEGEDVMSTLKALQHLGVSIQRDNAAWLVDGCGVGGFNQPNAPIDMGNAGTGARLMMGLVSSYPFECTFVGDASLSSRPMARVTDPLEAMGLKVTESCDGCLPITIKGGDLVPFSYALPVASAQVKSAILLAGLGVKGQVEVIENKLTRDHTERMLRFFGAELEEYVGEDGKHVILSGHPILKAQDLTVPGDPSSAAFLVVAALLVPGSEIVIPNICFNSQRVGLYTTLQEMGADITYVNRRDMCGEEVVDIVVKYSELSGVEVPEERAPSMIDEYPILSVAAAFAQGKTVMHGIGELRVKESNRLDAMAEGLKKCGVRVDVQDDELSVYGMDHVSGSLESISTYMDHRIAMSFLILGLASKQGVVVDDGTMINTSFPDFVGLINRLGGVIERGDGA